MEADRRESRFRVAVAPGELWLVQDLLNTAGIRKPRENVPDLLDAPDTAARWLSRHGIGGDSPGVSALQRLRDTVRQALIARDHDSGAAPARPVEAAPRMRLDADGTVRFVPGAAAIPALVERVLIAIYDAQRDGTWRRLKVCRNPQCLVAFWDASRNTSGAWHDVRTCGNAENLRRSRARRAAGGHRAEGAAPLEQPGQPVQDE
ncbi:CGNR zinc finger domain-containing protein [Catenuloplanes atrovinosus]|uniref:RNA-binding Zn ribbon-like protein n=1 Tax=Catenuloplanes atrovinosus TaxID=137266 RepID=A0AAE3YJY0_9ACTN|nr:CGNR zinc finger domain-containing protein [Catenuloplanes atrovinosus]MDR7275213.1 putative RNA-binding Zn ribbon-like protein [Catenuloplanes atrovinosus]